MTEAEFLLLGGQMGTVQHNFRFIDLFAGVGGFHHALSAPEFGGECVFAADIDDKCREVYRSTWPWMADSVHGDIRKFTRTEAGEDRDREELAAMIPDHDVLCAGFPCQPFSKSGAQMGERDQTRGTLFHDIVQIVEAKEPRFLILENVRNLNGPRHKETWATIRSELRRLGYRLAEHPVVLSPHLLRLEDGGRPQSRDRVFILATRAGDRESLVEEPLVSRAPSPDWDPNNWNVLDFLDDDSSIPNLDEYKLKPQEMAWLTAWQAFVVGIDDDSLPGFPIWVDEFRLTPNIAPGTPPWKRNFIKKNAAFYQQHKSFIDSWLQESWVDGSNYRVRDFPASRRKFEWQARSAQPSQRERDLWSLTIHFRPSGIRVKPATYLPALVAITQTSVIGSRKRRITPAEAAELQGLPRDVFGRAGVDDATAYKQAGNGVNVGVVQYVARALFAASGLTWGVSPESGSEAA